MLSFRRGYEPPLRAWRLTRSGTMDTSSVAVVQRSGAFASSAPAGSMVVTRRGEHGLEHYFVAPDTGRPGNAAALLGQAAAARPDEIPELPELLSGSHIAVMTVRPSMVIGQDTQAGADMSLVSSALSNMLDKDQWVAAVFRAPSPTEVKWYRRWFDDMYGGRAVHHSVQSSAVLMTVFAGANSVQGAQSIVQSVASALPGFDVPVVPQVLSPWDTARWSAWAAAGAAAAGVASLVVPALQGHVLATVAAFAVAAASVVRTQMVLSGRLSSPWSRALSLSRRNRLPVPARLPLPPRRPRPQKFRPDGGVVEATHGQYPFPKDVVAVGPQLAVAMVAPHAGNDSGHATTLDRPAPGVMRGRIGPYMGDNLNERIHLSAEDMYQGVALFGKAGSGKTRAVQALFAWSCLERVRPSGLPGFPGVRNTLIAFESKGEGADEYEAWGHAAGDKVLRIDFAASAATMGLDILNVPGDAERRARSIVNALKYAFSDGSIQERSFDTLIQVFTAAFAVSDNQELLAMAPEVTPGKSPFYYASVLLGNYGDVAGVSLAAAIRSEAARRPDTTDLVNASQKLANLYEGKSVSARASVTDAPRNKVSALLAAEQFWARPYKVSWDSILERHRAVIINTGAASTGAGSYEAEDDELTRQMSAVLMYTLYDAIKRRCAGWWDQGRGVSIFADELKLLTGSSATVLTWMREQGRSYGVRPVFATQYPEQLTPEVKNSVMGFGTVLAFAQDNPTVVEGLVRDLTMTGEDWTGADVANLPKYHAIVRAMAGTRQAPFTLALRDFVARRDSFDTEQGYDA